METSFPSICMSKKTKAPALMAIRMVHAKQGIDAKAFKPSGIFSMCVSESILLPVNMHSVCRNKTRMNTAGRVIGKVYFNSLFNYAVKMYLLKYSLSLPSWLVLALF